MKRYQFTLRSDGQFSIHKKGCKDIKKEKVNHIIDDPWVIEANNVNDAISLAKQELFEDACGQGNYLQADIDDPAREYAEQSFYIVNCARG